MIKKISLLSVICALCSVNSFAATYGGASVADLTHGPGTRTRTTVNYEKYETRESGRTYVAQNPTVNVRRANTANLYYTEPVRRTVIQPDSTRMTVRSGEATTTMRRKYYLAHPFFQPLENKFGIVLDGGYAANSFDFESPELDQVAGNFDTTQIFGKLDLSYGISDELAVQLMARYDSTKYTVDWAGTGLADDEMKDSGINMYGAGLMWRFVDNTNWIGALSGYYQYQVDTANTFLLDLKAGYKVGRSTIYGLARGWYVDFDGQAYGVGISDEEAAMFLAYKTDVSNAMYFEGGLGIFSVLSEDWTANLEAVFGDYDWHNQLSLKAAIGWQPGDSFALNLYGKIALYDDADNKSATVMWQEAGVGDGTLSPVGTAAIDGYSDYTIGLQAIFYF